MSVDWTRPIQTRDGRKAKYVCEIKAPPYSRLVILDDESNTESPETYRENGVYARGGEKSVLDIINSPPPKVTVEIPQWWMNVYLKGDELTFYPQKSLQAAFNNLVNSANYLGTWQLPAIIEVVKP